MTAALVLDPVHGALVATGARAISVGPDFLRCPTCRNQFDGKMPGHVYGSNWAWVPCQTCLGDGRLVLPSDRMVIATTSTLNIEALDRTLDALKLNAGPIWRLNNTPEAWMDAGRKMCANGHVSTAVQRRSAGPDRCLAAGCRGDIMRYVPPTWSDLPVGVVIGTARVQALPVAEWDDDPSSHPDDDVGHVRIEYGGELTLFPGNGELCIDLSECRPCGEWRQGHTGLVFTDFRPEIDWPKPNETCRVGDPEDGPYHCSHWYDCEPCHRCGDDTVDPGCDCDRCTAVREARALPLVWSGAPATPGVARLDINTIGASS